MLSGEDLGAFIDRLEENSLLLYHACQLTDLQSYAELGGVPSREVLQASGKAFTAFDTDEADKENEVWKLVFLNLHDFGGYFANGGKSVPTPYGPVLLALKPSALAASRTVAICTRSAGGQDFNREKEAIRAEECDRLFKPGGEGYSSREFIRNGKELRHWWPKAHDPEVSCDCDDDLISLKDIDFVRVDSFTHDGKSTKEIAQEILAKEGFCPRIYHRKYKPNRDRLYQELCAAMMNEDLTLDMVSRLSEEAAAWVNGLQEYCLDYQFKRFQRYIKAGTLSWF